MFLNWMKNIVDDASHRVCMKFYSRKNFHKHISAVVTRDFTYFNDLFDIYHQLTKEKSNI